jgi:hypothetical protein
MARTYLVFGDIDGKLDVLRVECARCQRKGRCKSLFALVIKISFGCTRDFRVKMWGTSSPEDKLAGDIKNARNEEPR